MSRPRISLPDLDRLSADQQRVADAVTAGPRGEVRGPVRLWLHSPDLADRAQKLGAFFRLGTSVPQRICELVILVTARHYDCDYIWFNHSRMALKRGLSAETIERLRRRQAPDFDQPGDSTAYDFATAILQGGKVPDPVLENAIALFGERGVVELGALIAHYHSGAIVLSLSDTVLPDGSRSCLD
jgi:4-carboxymuconolactone decarboxylase